MVLLTFCIAFGTNAQVTIGSRADLQEGALLD
jgi:hypothetical protein